MSDDWNKLKHLVDLSAENARLKAEVERLRKEGEAMYPNLGPGWSHKAKEGKQS